jgi:hypothetical protein
MQNFDKSRCVRVHRRSRASSSRVQDLVLEHLLAVRSVQFSQLFQERFKGIAATV